MITNVEYDLSQHLAVALSGRSPFAGIPIPGHTALIFPRAKLKTALRGVKPVSIQVTVTPDGARFLTVEGVAGARCRTFMRMRSLRRDVFLNPNSEESKTLSKWRPTPARIAGDKQARRTAKYDKALAKLEKQLAKLGDRPDIQNPCLSSGTANYLRDDFLRWHQQKDLRRKISALASLACNGKITAHEFYNALAPLTTVKRYSDFTAKQRERIIGKVPFGHDGFMIYVHPKNLWKFLPGLTRSWNGMRPKLYWGSWQEAQSEAGKHWGTERYQSVLEWSRKRQEILSQMQGIRDMQPAAALSI